MPERKRSGEDDAAASLPNIEASFTRLYGTPKVSPQAVADQANTCVAKKGRPLAEKTARLEKEVLVLKVCENDLRPERSAS